MQLDLTNLPADTEQLHRLVRDMALGLEHRDGEIERLHLMVKQLQRSQFGRRSEQLDPDQLTLGLEDVETDIGEVEVRQLDPKPMPDERPRRKALSDHLPRHDVVLDALVHKASGENCAGCGATLHSIGESVSEMLDNVPAELRVIRIRRPKYARCIKPLLLIWKSSSRTMKVTTPQPWRY